MGKTVDLYSVQKGEIVEFDLEIDQNGEIVANRADNDGSDSDEHLKFPAGLDNAQFGKLIARHNKANEGVVARDPKDIQAEEEAKEKSEELLDSL